MKEHQRRDFLIGALHVFIVSSFAVAQPLFDLLSRNAEFFVARHSQPIEVVLFVLIVMVAPAAVLLLLEGVAGLLGRQIRKGVHGVIVALLAGCIFLPALKQVGEIPGKVLLVGAMLSGIVAASGYLRFSLMRTFVTVLFPALVIFPGLFLLGSPVKQVVFGDNRAAVAETPVRNAAPVILVVFDEFPIVSLMDEQRQIDSIRYPNFAALARHATWFRNATTVHGSTFAAVPAILNGRYPNTEGFPTARDYPETLFTLLGGSYAMNVFEPYTRVCPDTLCEHFRRRRALDQRLASLLSDLSLVYLHILLPPDLTANLPAVTQTWEDFGGQPGVSPDHAPAEDADLEERGRAASRDRQALFSQFVHSITATDKPTLHFLHSLLPHVPWEFLPSGKRYQKREIPGLDITKEEWGEDDWLVVQGYQRHLLQVGFVDKLLGDLLTRLQTLGLYDQSLIVITADHGASFWPNESRRGASPAHPQDIFGVPLFMKTPYQQEGRVSDRPVKTIDIVPTIADILGVALPWPVDGRSVYTTEIICAGETPIPVIPNSMQGRLDGVGLENESVQFGGWAADVAIAQLPETLLVFANGQLLYAGQTEVDRPDVVQVYGDAALQKSGFYLTFSRSTFANIADSGVRLFAVSRQGVASELEYPATYPWKPASFFTPGASEERHENEKLCQARTPEHGDASYTLMTIRGIQASVERIIAEKGGAVSPGSSGVVNDTLAQKLALFGSGTSSDRLYTIGPHNDLIGRHVREIGVNGEARLAVEIEQPELYEWVTTGASFVPAYLTGKVSTDTNASGPINLAIAVNDVVRAVTRTFSDEENVWRFAALVPETAFHSGRNEVEVFAVSEEKKLLRLTQPRSKSDVTYSLTMAPGQANGFILSSLGESFRIVLGGLTAHVDTVRIQDEVVNFSGWAADVERAQPVEAIVIFRNGEFFFAGQTHVDRPDVAEAYKNAALQKVGFHYGFPEQLFEGAENVELSFFAVSKEGVASELIYPAGYRWGKES